MKIKHTILAGLAALVCSASAAAAWSAGGSLSYRVCETDQIVIVSGERSKLEQIVSQLPAGFECLRLGAHVGVFIAEGTASSMSAGFMPLGDRFGFVSQRERWLQIGDLEVEAHKTGR